MNAMKTTVRSLVALVLLRAACWPGQAATLVLQFDALNYSVNGSGQGTWLDSSGNLNAATQTTAAYAPALVATATPSGQPAVQFNGTNQFLVLRTALNSTHFLPATESFTILTVVKTVAPDNTIGTGTFIGGGYGMPNFAQTNGGGAPSGTRRLALGNAGYGDPTQISDWVHLNTWQIDAMVADLASGTIQFYTNGVLVANYGGNFTTNPPFPSSGGFDEIGAQVGGTTSFFQGQMAALYVYDGVLDAATVGAVTAQLYDDYLAFDPTAIIGTVTMGTNTTLSASVYDLGGQVVRHLYEGARKTGTVNLVWDGKDDFGYDAISTNYQWRAITTSAVGSDDGSVGDGGRPPNGNSENPGLVQAAAFDGAGNLYLASAYEETWATLRRINAANITNGTYVWWGSLGNGATAVATDSTNVFVAIYGNVSRFNAATGTANAWSGLSNGVIAVTTSTNFPVAGLGVDGTRLWVSDPADNQVKLYDKTTGTAITNFALTASRGIAADGSGNAWIAYNTNTVAKFTSSGTKVSGSSINSLQNPFGVAFYSTNSTKTLYITEINTGHVLKYNVASTPSRLNAWFGLGQPGKVTDTDFWWKYDTLSGMPGGNAAIAVAPAPAPNAGQFAVTDICRSRLLMYNSSGSLVTKLQGFNWPTPSVNLSVGQDILTSCWLQYSVSNNVSDPNYGHPWSLTHSWLPTNGVYGLDFPGAAWHLKLTNGVEYLYAMMGGANLPWGGVLIYKLNTVSAGVGMRHSAMIGQNLSPGNPVITNLWVKTDTNGNDKIGDSGDTTTTANGSFIFGNPGWSVDTNGTFWINLFSPDGINWWTAKLPISSFDSQNNPVYNWNNVQLVFPKDTSPWGYNEQEVRYNPSSNRFFGEGTTAYRPAVWFNYAGSAVEVRDFSTGQHSVFQIPTQALINTNGLAVSLRATVGGLAVDTDGNYFYTGDSIAGGPAQEVHMFTWDGLPVASAMPLSPGNGGGWFDSGMSLAAFTHTNGNHYVYTEDNYFGRHIRYKFANVSSTVRSSGNFNWSGASTSTGLIGWWKFDEQNGVASVFDSSGNGNNGTRGWSGWSPYGGLFHGAMPFNPVPSNVAIVFLPDNLIENTGYSTLTLACWIKTSTNGVIMGYQDIPWDTSRTPPGHYVPMMYIGLDGKARACVNGASSLMISAAAVTDNQWHHLALVVDTASQAFYVDGVVVGTSSGGLAKIGLTKNQFGAGYTTGWDSCPGGWQYFNGLLDETRLYNRALSGDEVVALATLPALSGPVAWWKFDETNGTLAADSSDHGWDGTVTNGTWNPTGGHLGGALSCTGTTILSLPSSLVESPAYVTLSFAAWIKTSNNGVIMGYQNGAYPGTNAPSSNNYVPLLYVGQDGKAYGTVWMNGGHPLNSPRTVNDGQWHHLALTVGATTMTLYVDGAAVASETPGLPWGVLSQGGFLNNQIGVGYCSAQGYPSTPLNTWFFYTGLLDDARFYGRELSAAEVAALAAT